MSKVNADIFLGTIWRFVFLCLNLYMKCSNIVVHSVYERKTKYEGKNIPAGATVHETQNSFYRYFNSKWQKFHLKTDIRWSASLMQRRLHCILWVTILVSSNYRKRWAKNPMTRKSVVHYGHWRFIIIQMQNMIQKIR